MSLNAARIAWPRTTPQIGCALKCVRHMRIEVMIVETQSALARGSMEPHIDKNIGINGEPDAWVHSACILCSNGCGLNIAVKGGHIVGVRGDPHHPVNFGHLGPKGENAWVANSDPRRGTRPMIRRKKTDPLVPVSWDEAMEFFIEKFLRCLEPESGESFVLQLGPVNYRGILHAGQVLARRAAIV